jgi:hypothetical protein
MISVQFTKFELTKFTGASLSADLVLFDPEACVFGALLQSFQLGVWDSSKVKFHNVK